MNIKNITKKCIQKNKGVVFELGRFKFIETGIDGLTVIDIEPFGDSRGYFMETYNREDFVKAGLDMNFVQNNESKSIRGVLRGLHFQKNFPQGKLVRCVEGEVFDVAVDLRAGSKTFGKWYGVILSESNFREFYIPRLNRENSLYGTEFEVRLRNEFKQNKLGTHNIDTRSNSIFSKCPVAYHRALGHGHKRC